MADLFETTQIPDDPEHWDALAERVAATAVDRARMNGLHWLASSRAGWLAASLLVAAVLAVVMGPGRDSSATNVRENWAQALAPADQVGRTIVSRDDPPAIGALLISAGGGKR